MQRRLRLRDANDFKRLRQSGRVYHHSSFTLSLLENDLDHNRYGVIVAKRLGKSVTRNRTRRLLREALRLCHPHLRQGFDMVWIARTKVVGQPFRHVQRTVQTLCKQAGVLQELDE